MATRLSFSHVDTQAGKVQSRRQACWGFWLIPGFCLATHQMTEAVSWLLTLSPCSLTLYLFHFWKKKKKKIWNQNQLETTAEKSGLLGCLLDEHLASYTSTLPQRHAPPPQPQGLLIYFRVESRSLQENRAAEPAIHLEMSASCFIVFFLQAKFFFFFFIFWWISE